MSEIRNIAGETPYEFASKICKQMHKFGSTGGHCTFETEDGQKVSVQLRPGMRVTELESYIMYGFELRKSDSPFSDINFSGMKEAAINPEHYKGDIEAIDAMKACSGRLEFQGHLRLNAMKYLWRLNQKGSPLENAKKAKWYIDKLIKELGDD